MEAEQYYSEKKADAEQRLKILDDAHGQQMEQQQQEYFEITDDKIAVIDRATEIIKTTGDFAEWCTNNFETHAPQCYYVFEDFVNNNEQIASKIDKVINN